MSILFESKNLGKLTVKNRFIRSATYEHMATSRGEVTEELISLYRRLAKGDIGLIIPGHFFVHPLGRANQKQIGIHEEYLVKGLKNLVDAVHEEGGKIAFQLSHAGRQTYKKLIGTVPMAPSSSHFDLIYRKKPRTLLPDEIEEIIQSFSLAAKRAADAGADAIQFHAAHGYLINQFLSPFFNTRTDEWGGSGENRFRFLREIISRSRKLVGKDFPLLVKLNSNDYTPKEGMTPNVAATYSKMLVDIGIDGVEISCGTLSFSGMNVSRGKVPAKEISQTLPHVLRILGFLYLNSMKKASRYEDPYNLQAAKQIKPALGNVPLILVGGLRKISNMARIIEEGHADFISMSRPFTKEPFLVNNFKEGKSEESTCTSCNNCYASSYHDLPIRCYEKGFPAKK